MENPHGKSWTRALGLGIGATGGVAAPGTPQAAPQAPQGTCEGQGEGQQTFKNHGKIMEKMMKICKKNDGKIMEHGDWYPHVGLFWTRKKNGFYHVLPLRIWRSNDKDGDVKLSETFHPPGNGHDFIKYQWLVGGIHTPLKDMSE